MPASTAAWKAAAVRAETWRCPRGRTVPSMSVRMSFTATFFSLQEAPGQSGLGPA